VTMTASTTKYCKDIKRQNTTVGWTCTSNWERRKTKAAFHLKRYQTLFRQRHKAGKLQTTLVSTRLYCHA
jgi:hypothetical protein